MAAADFHVKALVTILACDALLALTGIPLLLRKVPRNAAYGFRTRTTLSDDFIWYEANAHFGRGLFLSSAVSAAAILLLDACADLSPQQFINASVAVLAVPPLGAALLTQRFVRTLRRGL